MGTFSPLAFIAVFLGGILTSFSPCILSMIPVMVGYIGGYGPADRYRGFSLSLAFVLGLALTFSILGLSAALMGQVFGQIGVWWRYVAAAIAIIMGLNLLGVLSLNLSFLGWKGPMSFNGGSIVGAFFIGIAFGLVASPCVTPVLAALLALVASQGDTVGGGMLLFVYGLGHGLPLILVGTFTAALKGLSGIRKYSIYVNYVSGILLIALGLYLLW